jgi:hypothetical protein
MIAQASSLGAYHDHITRKRVAFEPSGLIKIPELNSNLKPLQAHCVEFGLRCGCAGLFKDTGLGKTFDELEWGRVVVEHTNKPVLMLAPLAVGLQHEREAERWGIDAVYRREAKPTDGARIIISNYERLERFDPDMFSGVILDESSIIANFTGATTRKLTKAFERTPFRLSASATPAPNDTTELGQHASFLGIMRSAEMLTRWFINDSRQMGKYRLKRAAVGPFWEWVASWARCVSMPSDLGFSDEGYELPELETLRHILRADVFSDTGEERNGQGRLFRVPENSATSIHTEKRRSCVARAEKVADILSSDPDEIWLVWCDTDYEAEALRDCLGDIVEVSGSQHIDEKEEKLDAFARGELDRLLTKPSIAGFGSNWQHCARMAFAGINFSYQTYYQALRRCWRFGQTRPVQAHIVGTDTESGIWNAQARKAADHQTMKREMTAAMARASRSSSVYQAYEPNKRSGLPAWMVS